MADNTKTDLVANANAICNAMGAMAIAIAKGSDEYTLLTSWDVNGKGGLQRLEQHECDVEDNGVRWVNIPIEVIAFSLKPHVLPDNNGNSKTLPALTLETKAGDLFTLFSNTALKTFASRLRTHLSEGPLSEKRPIKLKLIQREGEGTNKYYWFERTDNGTGAAV